MLWVAGFPMFFGFVSKAPSVSGVASLSINVLCVAIFVWMDALVPFLIGAFCAVFFMFPVGIVVHKGIVVYDYENYSLGVVWTTGISNAVTFVLLRWGWLTDSQRWILQCLGWPIILSGLALYEIQSEGENEAYKLNTAQTIRYSAFQVSLYIFVYYGFCKHVEEMLNLTA